MYDLRNIIAKLKEIISEEKQVKKVFDKDVADALTIPQTTFATMKKRNSIPFKEILEFCANKKLSINWLFFDQAIDMLEEETERFFQVHYFSDVRASAGGGAFNFDENYEVLSIDKTIMKSMVPSLSNALEAINIDGESMEPTLQDGSIAFIDREQTNINKDGIFIAATTAGLFIKRIRQRADGMIELISDNKAYSPEIITADEVEIVGRVVGNVESL
ncbi:MAG: phage repressor protein, putative [uncultured Sulfurovum sp.]|uniref:Phage repressor protein, putative n=1 Tax=uncultured Sulfurovum sp. TaxID=269237 RepID=A0A6S6TLF4_9BACT|nr:MAG: phage repressor protein, putative [uncultured Sulfurovum sp.]